MIDRSKRPKKVSVSEVDISSLFQRYSARTVLTLLQEVDQFQDRKIDWNDLVKKSLTGITNAREYQMLWRHLAYRNALLDEMDEGAQPFDDDSDFECEVEAFPPAGNEASNDAAAYVKVLSDSAALARDSNLPNNSAVEGPLTINIPTGLSYRDPSRNSQPASLMQTANITVPVFVHKQAPVHKQPLPVAPSTEGLDANGASGGTLPPRRKRKPWSEAEDLELIAAVQRCGEGNWANILRGDFKGDRTASQLSQRWAIIRKRHGNLTVGVPSSNGPQLSEAQLAARHAMSLALKMPVKNLSTAPVDVLKSGRSETLKVGSSFVQALSQSQQGSLPPKSTPMVSSCASPKPRVITKKTLSKSFSSESNVKATAVAAGARIASPSDAATLLKAAQSKNAVHIIPSGGSLIKPSVPGAQSKNAVQIITSGGSLIKPSVPCAVGNQLGTHPSVHYICTGLVTPNSTYPSVISSTSRPSLGKSAATTVQHIPTTSTATTMSPDLTNAFMSSLATELPAKQNGSKVSQSDNQPKEQIHKDGIRLPGKEQIEPVRVDKVAPTDSRADFKSQEAVEDPGCSLNAEATKTAEVSSVGHQAKERIANGNGSKVMSLPAKEEAENQSAVQDNSGTQSKAVSEEKKLEAVSKEAFGSENVAGKEG